MVNRIALFKILWLTRIRCWSFGSVSSSMVSASIADNKSRIVQRESWSISYSWQVVAGAFVGPFFDDMICNKKAYLLFFGVTGSDDYHFLFKKKYTHGFTIVVDKCTTRGPCELAIRLVSPEQTEQVNVARQCTASLTITCDTLHCTPGVPSSSTRTRERRRAWSLPNSHSWRTESFQHEWCWRWCRTWRRIEHHRDLDVGSSCSWFDSCRGTGRRYKPRPSVMTRDCYCSSRVDVSMCMMDGRRGMERHTYGERCCCTILWNDLGHRPCAFDRPWWWRTARMGRTRIIHGWHRPTRVSCSPVEGSLWRAIASARTRWTTGVGDGTLQPRERSISAARIRSGSEPVAECDSRSRYRSSIASSSWPCRSDLVTAKTGCCGWCDGARNHSLE